MDKQKALKIVNPILFVSAIIQISTGIILAFHLFKKIMGFIGEVHEYNGFLLSLLILIHLYLNWSWVKATFFRKKQVD